MHQIQQHILDINCTSQLLGKEVQNVVGALMEKEFYPRLEQLLDQYPIYNDTWILDKVVINLPPISQKKWKEELVSGALNEIEAFLNMTFKEMKSINHNQHVASSSKFFLDVQHAEFLFFEYLKTGLFNQNLLFKNVLDIEEQLNKLTFSSTERKKLFLNQLVALFLENQKSLLRFIYTVSEKTKKLIKEEGVGFLFDATLHFKNEKELQKKFSSSNEFNNWINLLEWSLFLVHNSNSQDIFYQFKNNSHSEFGINADTLNSLLDFYVNSSDGKIPNAYFTILFNFKKHINSDLGSQIEFNQKLSVHEDITETSTKHISDKNSLSDEITKNKDFFTTTTDKSITNSNLPLNLDSENGAFDVSSKKADLKSDFSEQIDNDSSKDFVKNIDSKTEDHKENLKKIESKISDNQYDKRSNRDVLSKLNENEFYNRSNKEHLTQTDKNNDTNDSNEGHQIQSDINNDSSEEHLIQSNTKNDSNDGNGANIIQSDTKNNLDKLKNNNKIFKTDDDSKLTYKRFNLDDDSSDNLLKSSNKENNNSLFLEEPIYIQNSGLVILHPFLIHLFEELNLCKNEEWISKKSQTKAVLITQHLITGSTVFFENDLALNKILCGLEVDAVIDLTIRLTKKDLKEAKGLLEAVIGYWKILKNTSIDGLRETFLQRNGKLLFKKEDTIELWVEQKGVDVLMAQIPWTIGMIKTPWMKIFMECHWS